MLVAMIMANISKITATTIIIIIIIYTKAIIIINIINNIRSKRRIKIRMV